MKTSDLNKIIISYSPEACRRALNLYKDEFLEYEKSISKRGSFVHIHIIEDESIFINSATVTVICKYYLNRILNEIEVNFVVDNILSSNKTYGDSELIEIIESLTDPEINGHMDDQYIRNIIAKLGDYTD